MKKALLIPGIVHSIDVCNAMPISTRRGVGFDVFVKRSTKVCPIARMSTGSILSDGERVSLSVVCLVRKYGESCLQWDVSRT
jgi:hypothetical protein